MHLPTKCTLTAPDQSPYLGGTLIYDMDAYMATHFGGEAWELC